MFYFLAFNSSSVISGNDISVYPVTGIGFVCWDFSKVLSRTFRLDIAELTLRAVIKWYPIKISKNVVFVLFLPHVFLQVGIKQFIWWVCLFCLFGFLTSSSTTRLYRGRAPRQERLTILRAATHETELGDHDFCLSRSHYTDTDPTSRERAATAGIEPGTSSPGVARSTAELPRPPIWWAMHTPVFGFTVTGYTERHYRKVPNRS